MQVAVVGAGTMGGGIAQVAAVAWGQSWGPATVLGILEAMHAWYGEDRYRPSALLRRIAAAGGST